MGGWRRKRVAVKTQGEGKEGKWSYWRGENYRKPLTVQFYDSICFPQGVFGHTPIGVEIPHLDTFYCESHHNPIVVLVIRGLISVACSSSSVAIVEEEKGWKPGWLVRAYISSGRCPACWSDQGPVVVVSEKDMDIALLKSNIYDFNPSQNSHQNVRASDCLPDCGELSQVLNLL